MLTSLFEVGEIFARRAEEFEKDGGFKNSGFVLDAAGDGVGIARICDPGLARHGELHPARLHDAHLLVGMAVHGHDHARICGEFAQHHPFAPGQGAAHQAGQHFHGRGVVT